MTLQHTVLESGLDAFFNLDLSIDSLSVDALRQQKTAGLDRKLYGLVLSAPNGARPVATNSVNGYVTNQAGESLGRLGSQVWSPRYQHQLMTVMLEKPFFIENSGEQTVELMLQDGSSAKASILPLPFNFSDAGIAAA